MMYNFLKHYDIPCIVIATKADKISKSKWQKHLKVTTETLDLDQKDTIILFLQKREREKMKRGLRLKIIWHKIPVTERT